MTGWQVIDTAPKTGEAVICGWQGQSGFALLHWKSNPRIAYAHGQMKNLDLVVDYFGDLEELDDYDYAKPENFPTHWYPVEPLL